MQEFLLSLSRWEGQFLIWLQRFVRKDVLDAVMAFYTTLGNYGLVWIVLCLAFLLHPKTRRAGAAGILALLCSVVLTNGVLKNLVRRVRPWLILKELVPLVAERDPNSFPSGHTSAAFAAAMAWSRTLPKRWMRIAGWVVAVTIGLSRLYVGVHFPADVICGALVGTLSGFLGWKLLLRMEEKRNKNDGAVN